MAAAVPMIVALTEERMAITMVLDKAFMICRSLNRAKYQLKVKPDQFVLDLEALKEKIIRMRMGAYKNR
jgi:hypothetical protein